MPYLLSAREGGGETVDVRYNTSVNIDHNKKERERERERER